MSDKPLWTNEQIEAEMRRIGDNMRLYIADACSVAEQVRDDYQAALAAAELEQLRARLVEVEGWARAANDVIAHGVELMPVDQLGQWTSVGYIQQVYEHWEQGVSHWATGADE